MDPYLENPKLWAAFHHQLVAALYQLLLPGLVDRYRARIGSRHYTSEFALFTSVIRETHTEEYVEIRSRTDGRLVTLVEAVSPANKTTSAGRTAYLTTRTQATTHRAATVEIDLITQGKPTLDFSRDGLPVYDYAVTVTRGGTPERYEIYTATVQKRLPKFKLPLAPDDRDTVLDLQVAAARAYDLGDFARQLDYTSALPADVKFTDESRNWVETWLRQQNVK
jgi:hypothetical protein